MREPGTPTRTSRRFWRIAFGAYIVLLTTATHWPQLQLPASSPASDKMIHFVVFAGFAVLLWQTQWFRSRWMVTLLAGLWAVLDEWSQALPGLNRFTTWSDVTANVLGVLVVGAWLWAMRPAGTHLNALRLAMHRYLLDVIFARLRTWIVLTAMVLVCAGVVVFAAMYLPPNVAQVVIVAAALVTISAGGMYLVFQWRAQQAALSTTRPCFECGQKVPDDAFGESSWSRCVHCGASVHADQWREPPRPSTRQWLGAAGWPLVLGLVLCGGLVIAMLLAAVAFRMGMQSNMHAELWLRASKTFGQQYQTLLEVIDLAVCLFILAVVMRLLRVRLARFYDRAVRCSVCGHDLTGTPAPGGVGRCGECGSPFERAVHNVGRSQHTSMAGTASSSR